MNVGNKVEYNENMNKKQQLINMLELNDDYLSGNVIAEELGITRAAVWKYIKQLQEDGYEIEAVTNRGYKLSDTNDVISEGVINKYLGTYADKIVLEVRAAVTSTNDVLKENAPNLPPWQTLVAMQQTAGKGRRGRSFYSPADTGFYLSILLKMDIRPEIATRFTTAAAVAACRAIENCTDAQPSIKWVNDVFADKHKVCGILTEASISVESGGLDWAVMGIGFNVYEPEGGFPKDISNIAGAISREKKKDLRSRIAADFIKNFYDICLNITDSNIAAEYKERSFMIGQEILVMRGDEQAEATAINIDDECRLVVRYTNGRIEALSSGEVSTRIPDMQESTYMS